MEPDSSATETPKLLSAMTRAFICCSNRESGRQSTGMQRCIASLRRECPAVEIIAEEERRVCIKLLSRREWMVIFVEEVLIG